MKIKKAFTLAEVLITLGIIGVVAALTTPALINGTGNAKVGPQLAKFANTFETASEALMLENSINRITTKTLTTFLTLLSTHMDITPYEGGEYSFTDAEGVSVHRAEYNNADYDNIKNAIFDSIFEGKYGGQYNVSDLVALTNQRTSGNNSLAIYQLKDGLIMVVVPVFSESITNIGTYKGIVAEILIDIDGNNQINKAGTDVFAFLLDGSGVLIPASSGAHKLIGQNGFKYITSYSDTCNLKSTDLNLNFACTGKIADNGWNYKGFSTDGN